MSSYQLQKLIYEVNRDPLRREEYRKDPGAFTTQFELTSAEKQAVATLDIRTLYQLGVHPLLLRPFTLLHRVSNEDYAKALSGLE